LANVSTCSNTWNAVFEQWNTVYCCSQISFLKCSADLLSIYQVPLHLRIPLILTARIDCSGMVQQCSAVYTHLDILSTREQSGELFHQQSNNNSANSNRAQRQSYHLLRSLCGYQRYHCTRSGIRINVFLWTHCRSLFRLCLCFRNHLCYSQRAPVSI
jgi:hypothetical protein